MKMKSFLKVITSTLVCALTMGIIPTSNEIFPDLSTKVSAETYYVTYPEENTDFYIAAEVDTNYVLDLCGGGTETYTGFHLYEKNGSDAQIYTLKRVDGDWYNIIHKASGKCLNVVNGESFDDARFWLYPGYDNDYASQFRFAAAGDSYIIQNRLDTQRIIDLHDNIVYSGAKVHLWSLHDGQSGRWKLIPANSATNSYYDNSYSTFSTGSYVVNSSNGVNVREGAGTNYRRVGASVNGTVFTVTQTVGDWGYTDSIKTTSGWKSGWVCLSYCNILPYDDYSYNEEQYSSEMNISDSGIDYICSLEGFHKYCYRDASQNSIGYGTRCGSKMHNSGTHSITRQEAKEAMESQLNSKYVPRVRKQTEGLYLTQNQFDALTSLCYNTGGGTSVIYNSPLVKYLRGELTKDEAITKYKAYYVYSNGVKLSGLVNRRATEAELFFS